MAFIFCFVFNQPNLNLQVAYIFAYAARELIMHVEKRKRRQKEFMHIRGVCNAVMRSVSEIETECDHSNALRPKFTNLFKCVVLKCLS